MQVWTVRAGTEDQQLRAGIFCHWPPPLATPCHCLLSCMCGRLLAKGSAPGAWTHLPTSPGVETTAWCLSGALIPVAGTTSLVIILLPFQPQADSPNLAQLGALSPHADVPSQAVPSITDPGPVTMNACALPPGLDCNLAHISRVI